MPVARYFKNQGEPAVPRYTTSLAPFGPHGIYWSLSEESLQKGLAVLKALAQEIDKYSHERKEAQKTRNIEHARWLREYIGDLQKEFRAWRFVLGFFVAEKTLPYVPCSQWPTDLAPELDWALSQLEYID